MAKKRTGPETDIKPIAAKIDDVIRKMKRTAPKPVPFHINFHIKLLEGTKTALKAQCSSWVIPHAPTKKFFP